MAGFDVAQGALVDAAGATVAARERLRAARDRIDGQVEDLLAGSWCGSAADSFRECWDAWLGGARDVIEGLDAMGSLLVATRHDYAHQDDCSEKQLSSVADRIVERLG